MPCDLLSGRIDVDAVVAQRQPLDMFADVRLRHAVEGTVDQRDVADGRAREAAQVQRVFRPLGPHPLHEQVADDWREAALVGFFVIEVDPEYGLRNLPDFQVADEDVFDHVAAHRVVLDPDRDVELRAVELTVFSEYVADPGGGFAADRDGAMSVFHVAAANYDVLRRHPDTAAVGIASGFDRDAVVTGVEEAVLDEHVAARFGIAAVSVRAARKHLDVEPSDGNVRAQHRMHLPHRRVAEFHALDQDVCAAVRLDEIGPQVVTRSIHAVAHRHAALGQIEQAIAIGVLGDVTGLPAA